MSAPQMTDEAALLWIGATDDGWAPWLAPGGRCDGGATPSEDARTEPPPSFMSEEERDP